LHGRRGRPAQPCRTPRTGTLLPPQDLRGTEEAVGSSPTESASKILHIHGLCRLYRRSKPLLQQRCSLDLGLPLPFATLGFHPLALMSLVRRDTRLVSICT